MSTAFTPVIRPAVFPCDGTTPPLSDIIVFAEPPPGMAGEPYRWAGLGRNPGGGGLFYSDDLPSGLAIDNETGIVSGTPDAYFDGDIHIGIELGSETKSVTIHLFIND